jgi:esterase/lipase superfamily enzyme
MLHNTRPGHDRHRAGVDRALPLLCFEPVRSLVMPPLTFRRLIAAVFVLSLSTVLSGCSLSGGPREAAAEATPAPRQVDIFFATDRAPDTEDPDAFSSERGDMSYGITHVAIPPGHLMGRKEEPSLLKFQWSPDEHKHIKVRGVSHLDRDAFLQRLMHAVAGSSGSRIMIFVHGYNMEFAQASRDVAQFANDLKFGGPVLLFSWPSQGGFTGYTVDETNAEWAQADFVRLLNELLENVAAQNVYLVAHSMGNRILGRGMTTLAGDRLPGDLIVFREIVMIAPDIDADVFSLDIAPRLARTGIHVTVYASSNDRALMASKAFHGYARAGDAGERLLVLEGVETIDASDVSAGLLGHSYFAEDRRVMEDIFSLLQTGQRADNRFGLEAVDAPAGRYWTFRK